MNNSLILDPTYDNMLNITGISWALAVISKCMVFPACIYFWFWVPYWRKLKNYVYLNVVITFGCQIFYPFLVPYVIWPSPVLGHRRCIKYYRLLLEVYLPGASYCWLLVMTIILYSGVIKVFRSISQKYLISSLFSWGVPAVIMAIKLAITVYSNEDKLVEDLSNFTPMVILLIWAGVNMSVYIRVVNEVTKKTKLTRPELKRSRILKATEVFLLSGIYIFLAYLAVEAEERPFMGELESDKITQVVAATPEPPTIAIQIEDKNYEEIYALLTIDEMYMIVVLSVQVVFVSLCFLPLMFNFKRSRYVLLN